MFGECEKKQAIAESKQEIANKAESRRRISPIVHVNEDEGGYSVKAELPGVKESDISLLVENRIMTLNANNDVSAPDGYRPVSVEFPAVTFHAVFEIPDRVNVDGIESKLENGVLGITLPKKEAEKPRKIAVSIG